MNMDNEQFWKLLKPVHPRAEAFCRKITGNPDDGDDLYQESLLLALRKFSKLRDHNAFAPWLFRILVNCNRSRYRKSWWRRHVSSISDSIDIAGSADPRGKYDADRWIDRAMQSLSADDRAIVVLHEIEGWTIAELAEIFRKPEGTIKARLCRARRKMRLEIERYLSKQESRCSASEGNYALQRSKTADR
jgi:RNA polymerase sigma-70 factor, ECF subfamily